MYFVNFTVCLTGYNMIIRIGVGKFMDASRPVNFFMSD